MTVSRPKMTEKLDRLIDDVRLLRAQIIGLDRQLKVIEAYLKRNEPSEQQPGSSKSRSWGAAAARTAARTVLVLFAVGAATAAVLHYLVT
jgi:hypothetical protein